MGVVEEVGKGVASIKRETGFPRFHERSVAEQLAVHR